MIGLKDLPPFDFVNSDKQAVLDYILNLYKLIVGQSLSKADPRYLFILVITSVVIMLLNKINYTGKQNLLPFAEGDKLDYLGATYAVARKKSLSAKTSVQFTTSDIENETVVVPAGTRVSAGGGIYFALDEDLTILANTGSAVGSCTCTVAGPGGNGLAKGAITTLVDQLPYIASVSNVTESAGGTDVEDDDTYRDRIQAFPESLSAAGSDGAYKYFAKSASPLIDDVTVTSPEPGHVYIYPLLKNGEQAPEEIQKEVLAVCDDRKVRPLTDHVYCKQPTEVSYDVDITYYISSDDRSRANAIDTAVKQAVDDYVMWQRAKMGRDINPSKLIAMVMAAGAKRVDVTAPVFKHVSDGSKEDGYSVELAVNGSKSVNNGGVEDE